MMVSVNTSPTLQGGSSPAFCISIDYEFAWGYADHALSRADRERIAGEVAIVRRLLALFEKYQVPATWAIVGHLLEEHCPWNGLVAHPEYPRPIFRDERADWFAAHPVESEPKSALWYDTDDLIGEIVRASVGHEIGSHSYAHIPFDERVTERTAIRVDLANMRRVHDARGIPFRSFVFPRNIEGYHDELRTAGVDIVRSKTLRWYDFFPGILRRAAHLLDHFIPYSPTVVPKQHANGLVLFPDSMLLLGRNGLRKFIPAWLVEWKARRGITQAIRRNEVFHLWFHPSNFSYDTDTQFAILEQILASVAEARERGVLEVRTMGAVADTCAPSSGRIPSPA
jgi:peptidoglycan/xylan/chitin deacetylase (PgdA/CDA1 family)